MIYKREGNQPKSSLEVISENLAFALLTKKKIFSPTDFLKAIEEKGEGKYTYKDKNNRMGFLLL